MTICLVVAIIVGIAVNTGGRNQDVIGLCSRTVARVQGTQDAGSPNALHVIRTSAVKHR